MPGPTGRPRGDKGGSTLRGLRLEGVNSASQTGQKSIPPSQHSNAIARILAEKGGAERAYLEGALKSTTFLKMVESERSRLKSEGKQLGGGAPMLVFQRLQKQLLQNCRTNPGLKNSLETFIQEQAEVEGITNPTASQYGRLFARYLAHMVGREKIKIG